MNWCIKNGNFLSNLFISPSSEKPIHNRVKQIYVLDSLVLVTYKICLTLMIIKTKRNNTYIKVVIYSRSFVQGINNWRPDFDKIYLYAKDPYKAKHQYLINKREKLGFNNSDDPEALIEY